MRQLMHPVCDIPSNFEVGTGNAAGEYACQPLKVSCASSTKGLAPLSLCLAGCATRNRVTCIPSNKRGEYHVEFTINNKLYGVSISELKKAYKEVERWQSLGGSNFTIKLIELIAKADKYNKEKILKGFPEVVCAYLIWYWNLPIKKELLED